VFIVFGQKNVLMQDKFENNLCSFVLSNVLYFGLSDNVFLPI
jgi:hypothetical protein